MTDTTTHPSHSTTVTDRAATATDASDVDATTGKSRRPVVFVKGNEAAVRGALLAGCRAFFGYPITPASEIAHEAARLFPEVGGVFLQAESEIASINMVYGSASAGVRSMTASSSPGVSLMQEGLSYAAGSELPLVLVDIMRGGPGLGNIGAEQSDYFQMVKGGGHGNYRIIVLAPASVQEMCDLTMLAFELADRYRTPVCVLTDGTVGQMKEPLHLPEARFPIGEPDWAVRGDAATAKNLISSIYLDHNELEGHVEHLERKYDEITRREILFDEYQAEDAEVLVVGYGIIARIVQEAIDVARARGVKAGLFRPITLWPFPTQALHQAALKARSVLTVELSTGQLIEDVRLAVGGARPVHFHGRSGGVLPSVDDVLRRILDLTGVAGEGDSQ